MALNVWYECEIFSFDMADRVWTRMESLDGGALFLEHRKYVLGMEFLLVAGRSRTQTQTQN